MQKMPTIPSVFIPNPQKNQNAFPTHFQLSIVNFPLSTRIRFLQLPNIQLRHFQHGLHHPVCFYRIFIGHQFP